MEVIREKLPEYHQEMEKLRGTSPERFERAMMLVMPVVMEYLDLHERYQKLAETIIEEFKIEQELRKLSREYRKAAEDQQKKTAIEQSLQQLVRRQFELKMQRQAARLTEFEKRLEKQRQQLIEERERLEEQKTNIEQLVTERIEEVKSGKVRNSFRLKELGPGGPGRPDGPPPGMGKHGPRGDGPPAMDDGHRPMPPPGFGGPRGHHPPPTSGPADEEWPTDDETPSDNEADRQP
jgi:hypothetical protein